MVPNAQGAGATLAVQRNLSIQPASTIMWIGSREGAQNVRAGLAGSGFTVLEFADYELALASPEVSSVAVAIVAVEWDDVSAAIAKLHEANPAMQILAATSWGMPQPIGSCVRAGASDLVDFDATDIQAMSKQVQAALGRHRLALREHELLLKLRAINEEFLKNLVNLEDRNLTLQEQLEPEASVPDAWRTGSAYRVLVVDDEPSICELLSMALKDESYEVVTAQNGEQALETFGQEPFPLVITDKNLPGMGGLELACCIKGQCPETDLVMITGYASKDSAIGALNAGISAFIEKPFESIDQVVATIAALATKQQGRTRKRRHLEIIKERNREFLDQYRAVRSDMDVCLRSRGGQIERPLALVAGQR